MTTVAQPAVTPYRLHDRGSIPWKRKDISLRHGICSGSGVHAVEYGCDILGSRSSVAEGALSPG